MNNFKTLNMQELETINGGIPTLPPIPLPIFWIIKKVFESLEK